MKFVFTRQIVPAGEGNGAWRENSNVHNFTFYREIFYLYNCHEKFNIIFFRFGTRKKPPTPIRVPKNKRKQQFTNKWWVPKYLFNGSRYPVILSGSGYVTTRPAAQCLFNESMSLPFFHLEDVFLTGFAAGMYGIF